MKWYQFQQTIGVGVIRIKQSAGGARKKGMLHQYQIYIFLRTVLSKPLSNTQVLMDSISSMEAQTAINQISVVVF